MNYKRKRPRTGPTHHGVTQMQNNPRWFDIVFHTRPARRRSKELVRAVLAGRVDADSAAWPVGKAPQQYYW